MLYFLPTSDLSEGVHAMQCVIIPGGKTEKMALLGLNVERMLHGVVVVMMMAEVQPFVWY